MSIFSEVVNFVQEQGAIERTSQDDQGLWGIAQQLQRGEDGRYIIPQQYAGPYQSETWQSNVQNMIEGFNRANDFVEGAEWQEVVADDLRTITRLQDEGFQVGFEFGKSNTNRIYMYRANEIPERFQDVPQPGDSNFYGDDADEPVLTGPSPRYYGMDDTVRSKVLQAEADLRAWVYRESLLKGFDGDEVIAALESSWRQEPRTQEEIDQAEQANDSGASMNFGGGAAVLTEDQLQRIRDNISNLFGPGGLQRWGSNWRLP